MSDKPSPATWRALLDQATMRVADFANPNIRVVRRDEAEAIIRDALASVPSETPQKLTAKELDYSMRLHGRILILRERLKSTQLPDPQEITKELHALEWAVQKITITSALSAIGSIRDWRLISITQIDGVGPAVGCELQHVGHSSVSEGPEFVRMVKEGK